MSATNLASLLVDSAHQRPQRTAIKLDDVTVSYQQLDESGARRADPSQDQGPRSWGAHNVMKGYRKRPEATEEAIVDGRFHTGDLSNAVPLKDGQKVDEDELKARIKDEVASYKYPPRIWFVDGVPKTATGKILKREVKTPGSTSTR